jgi:hypothetical protein
MPERFEVDPDARKVSMEFERGRREAGVAGIALDFSTHWCPRHLAPYRATWPRGAAVAMVRLFESFTADPRVEEMTGGDVMRLAAVVLECSPLCCFVTPKDLDAIYAETGVRRRG